MTASLYGVMVLLPKVWNPTGLALVSSTQLAAGSPVMVCTLTPEPGMVMRLASCMKADCSMVLPQISALTSGSRMTLEVWREMS